jgi:tetratricopeptide (TPR) repeat protein
LSGFLRALGTPGKLLSDDLAHASAQYRSLLAGKRILILLDDVRSAEQIRPLLPGGDGCLVLVTSRDSLGGLVARDGARHLTLDALDPHDALELLTAALGTDRIQAEAEAAAVLVDLCARLPLALRIVVGRLLTRPDRHLADEVKDLSTDERLGALRMSGDSETAVRVVFDRSYAAAATGAQKLFRLLGLVPLREVTATTAAALLGSQPAVAADLLDELADAHLLTRSSHGRFGLHDLLRLYAAERMSQGEPNANRDNAARRLLLRLLADADAADRLLNPNRVRVPFPDDTPEPMAHDNHSSALAWLDTEYTNLVTAVRYAAQHGPRAVAWLLASTLKGYFDLRMLTQDWRMVATLGLAAAEAEGDDRARALAHLTLGQLHERLGDYMLAGVQTARAYVLARRAGWLAAEGVALSDLGILCRHSGQLAAANRYATKALEVARTVGWLPLLAGRMMSLGNLRAEAGDLQQAAELYTEVLPLFRQVGTHTGEAIALANLGECRLVLGSPDEAIDYFIAASKLNREVGHRGLAADNLRALAAAHLEAGRPALAVELAEAALAEHHAAGDRRYEAATLNVLAAAHQHLGDVPQAIQNHSKALEISHVIGVRRHEVTAMIGLAHCAERLGRLAEAREHANLAVTLTRRDGLRLLEGPALAALASVLLATGDLTAAADHAHQALAVLRQTGQRLDEARLLQTLSAITQRRRKPVVVAPCL